MLSILEPCKIGYYSNNGNEPCYACPIGTYQDKEGQSMCNVCPSGQMTLTANSTSLNQCTARDLIVKFLNGTVNLFTIQSNIVSLKHCFYSQVMFLFVLLVRIVLLVFWVGFENFSIGNLLTLPLPYLLLIPLPYLFHRVRNRTSFISI